ncbi:hypothetical protein P261_02646 [Lachnospiraceae bacterium TWA4]|nr:hypothetical protein P261_02646 [Lachnospiraceae bacterium TWA4]
MGLKTIIGDTLVDIDLDATQKWYEKTLEWDCACADCRRFIEAAKGKKLPEYTLKVLQELDIPPEKATYVCLLDGKDLYEYCYRIVGKVIEKVSVDPVANCRCELEHPCPSFEFPTPYFDIVFYDEIFYRP